MEALEIQKWVAVSREKKGLVLSKASAAQILKSKSNSIYSSTA